MNAFAWIRSFKTVLIMQLAEFTTLKGAIYIEIGCDTVYYITLKFRNTIYEIKWEILNSKINPGGKQ